MQAILTNILTVGIADKTKALKNLPIRLIKTNNAAEAVKYLREDRIDIVVSRWELADMPSGELLQKIVFAKPNTLTIAFVKSGDKKQEIAARSSGVSVVLCEAVKDEYFLEIINQLLSIYNLTKTETKHLYYAGTMHKKTNLN
jgi:DNA-binding NarL/FixJ family response regulator